jgi:uncharacterized protein YfaS (alpha-2-macroglobulin family)
MATETGSTMSWTSEWYEDPTPIALRALLAANPNDPRAIKVLRYLGAEKRGDAWMSTKQTAQIVLAAIEFVRAQRETSPNLDAVVLLGNKKVGQVHFDASNWTQEYVVHVPLRDLAKGANTLTVQMTGQGRVYYTASLEQGLYDPKPSPTDSGHGLRIKREYFRMETKRLEDGTIRLVPSNKPVTSARAGEVLHCRLTITSDRMRRYAVVEDPLLSNSHPVDIGEVGQYEWYYWWSDQTFLDDHAAVFMSYLEKGDNIVEYTVRAEATGTSFALPATVSLMYQPEVRATTGTNVLEVRQ